MIMTFGTLVLNDDISWHCFYFFFEFFFGGAVRGVKGKSIAQNENNNYSHHMPYLRNSIAYGHDFWYTFGL